MSINRRGRSWAFIVYPDDSLPENYMSIIQSWHVPTLLSPVHDKDLNADETEKKKHIHILVAFDGMKGESQIQPLSDQLNGTKVMLVDNQNGMIRYFIHYDNPEKHPYDKCDLVALSGFDYSNAFDSKANDLRMINLVESFINDYNVTNFYMLIQLLKTEKRFDAVDWLRFHTNTYIKLYIQQKYLFNHQPVIVDTNSKK